MHSRDLPRPISWKRLLNIGSTFYLVMLLVLSVISLTCAGQTGKKSCDNFVSDLSHVQTNISCEITNSGNGSAEINVSWFLIPEQAEGKIVTSNLFNTFGVSCNCSLSSGFINKESDYDSKSVIKHSVQLSNLNLSCYDKCSCFVYFNTRCSIPNPWSDPSTCHNGPAVPKAPPVIVSPPIRNFSNDENSVQVNFKLPPVNLYCDDSITDIIVNITQNDNGSHRYPKSYNPPLSTLQNDNGDYMFRFEFPIEQFQFWTPFDIAISVKNSVGLTPFSSYVTIKKDDNAIPKGQYKFLCHFNDELSMLYLYWNLSVKVKSMWNSHFITALQFTMEQLSDDSHSIMTYHMNNTNLTLNMSLKPNKWYLLVGRMLLEDSGIYGPEPSYAYFKTPAPAATDKHSSSSDDHKYYVIVMSISGFLTVIVILLLVYFKFCFKKPSHDYVQLSVHCDDDDDNDDDHDDHNDSNNHGDGGDDDDDDDDDDSSVKMRALGSVVGSSYVEQADDPSVVENL